MSDRVTRSKTKIKLQQEADKASGLHSLNLVTRIVGLERIFTKLDPKSIENAGEVRNYYYYLKTLTLINFYSGLSGMVQRDI